MDACTVVPCRRGQGARGEPERLLQALAQIYGCRVGASQPRAERSHRCIDALRQVRESEILIKEHALNVLVVGLVHCAVLGVLFDCEDLIELLGLPFCLLLEICAAAFSNCRLEFPAAERWALMVARSAADLRSLLRNLAPLRRDRNLDREVPSLH